MTTEDCSVADPAGRPDVPAQASAARRQRPPPVRSEAFDHLALEELRAYRNELGEEETRVSYWRRVLQARLDTLRGGVSAGADTSRRALARGLRSEDLGSQRTALLALVPADGLPQLPNLEELWRLDTAADPTAAADLIDRLARAERQLSAYRRSLHERLDAATTELIARYRESPALAIRALPLTPPTRPRQSGY